MIGHSSELIVFDWQFLHIHDLVYGITDKISARPVEVIENCRVKLKYTTNIDNCRLLVIFLFRPSIKIRHLPSLSRRATLSTSTSANWWTRRSVDGG